MSRYVLPWKDFWTSRVPKSAGHDRFGEQLLQPAVTDFCEVTATEGTAVESSPAGSTARVTFLTYLYGGYDKIGAD